MAKARQLHQKRGWAWTVVVVIVKPTLLAATKRNWIDGEKIPATGGCVVVVNHISHLDPMTWGSSSTSTAGWCATWPRTRCSRTPVLKHIVRNARQIPVTRMTEGAAHCVRRRSRGGQAGECIGVYPEGTITKDPDGWPMRGKTGLPGSRSPPVVR